MSMSVILTMGDVITTLTVIIQLVAFIVEFAKMVTMVTRCRDVGWQIFVEVENIDVILMQNVYTLLLKNINVSAIMVGLVMVTYVGKIKMLLLLSFLFMSLNINQQNNN